MVASWHITPCKQHLHCAAAQNFPCNLFILTQLNNIIMVDWVLHFLLSFYDLHWLSFAFLTFFLWSTLIVIEKVTPCQFNCWSLYLFSGKRKPLLFFVSKYSVCSMPRKVLHVLEGWQWSSGMNGDQWLYAGLVGLCEASRH
jgi:hypothetical protein